MSADEQLPAAATATETTKATEPAAATDAAIVEQERSEKILKAKELYSHGSRNFLVKSYIEAADELSQVCALYEELYGELSDELGMPYLLYAKSLIALALDENKVIDVPDEEEMEDDDDDEDVEDCSAADAGAAKANGEATSSTANGSSSSSKLHAIKEVDTVKECDEADSTAADEGVSSEAAELATDKAAEKKKAAEETQVSSTDDNDAGAQAKPQNGTANGTASTSTAAATPVVDGEKPSTSNGDAENGVAEEDEDNEAASNLQLAWEILELAAKIFSRQGMGGLPNLAEVQTELANIEFENNIPEAAREDYEKALKIYGELPTNYRRAMAEIHYKIGLTYLMQQLNKEGAESLKAACSLIDGEIEEIKAKTELTEKDKNNIQDMEETKQEIWAKIAEIEDTQAQNIAEVRAALDSYIKPIAAEHTDGAGPSSSAGAAASSSISSSTKPTDISHLIKRKKPEEPSSEAEAAASPAKKPAL